MDFKAVAGDLYCALGLDQKAVGVRLMRTREEFDGIDAAQIKGRLKYCVMVKKAAAGRSFKAGAENFGCGGAVNALGIGDRVDLSVANYMRLGLYANEEVAAQAMTDVTKIKQHIYGMLLMPLEECVKIPDVIIMLASSYQAMRVLQGYTYHHGVIKQVHLSGNQAFCSECTATPYIHQEVNLSVLCSGTRFIAGWDDQQMAIGVPTCQIEAIVDGILKTMNKTEPDEKKAEINLRAEKHNSIYHLENKAAYYYE